MEIDTCISYNGYRVLYKVTYNHPVFNAELTGFDGSDDEMPSKQFHFVSDNNQTIASSDVISIAKNILKEMNSTNSFNYYSM